ncbi:MAG: AraC family transcriptional regulator [Flavobacteriaceae bacterium]
MQLKYSITETKENQSFFSERKTIPYFGADWHYHEDYELLYPITGTGVRIVGDSIEYFNENELVLLGSKVPHLFKNEVEDSSFEVDYIVIKFKPALIHKFVENVPEFSNIKSLLEKSTQGILFSQIDSFSILKDLIEICESKGAKRIILLLSTLNRLALIKGTKSLSAENFNNSGLKAINEDRLQRVISFIVENYGRKIDLEELSEISFMTSNSFCRYFKERTGKTAFQFIREYRISRACQMIINSHKSIAQISVDTGFNAFSSFNRVFKSIKGVSASEYKSNYRKLKNINHLL